MLYKIWKHDPDNNDISVVETGIESLDLAIDSCNALNDEHERSTFRFALVGGKAEKRLMLKAEMIRVQQEEKKAYEEAQEKEARSLIKASNLNWLELYKVPAASCGNVFEAVDERPDGRVLFTCFIDELVESVQAVIDMHTEQLAEHHTALL